jgi:DNA repair protein RecO (recombination protein O)
MSIEKTEAVVLRTLNFRDSSKIVTFYTREYGKMTALAKGARNPKSKFGSLLQPLNYLQIVIYRRENRQMQYLSGCEFVRFFKTITANFEKLYVGMAILEIVDKTSHDEEENESLFSLITETLSAIDEPSSYPINALIHFGLKLSSILGYNPEFSSCLICRKEIDFSKSNSFFYVLERGGPLCNNCSTKFHGSFQLSSSALRMLSNYSKIQPSDAAKTQIQVELQRELLHFVIVYLKHHWNALKEIRSLNFLSIFN